MQLCHCDFQFALQWILKVHVIEKKVIIENIKWGILLLCYDYQESRMELVENLTNDTRVGKN